MCDISNVSILPQDAENQLHNFATVQCFTVRKLNQVFNVY